MDGILNQLELIKFSLIKLWLECNKLGIEVNRTDSILIVNNIEVKIRELNEHGIYGLIFISSTVNNHLFTDNFNIIYFRKTSNSNWVWCYA